ncbi:Nucleoside diphosphate kinase [Kalmanozyma brasiliensis GHG001]|uniref:Nucleoside diphosphate kinase n=1 Tax=Kalmanozyma brasiliensis (strain GHG001) TaxID=1365824 RepID=V5ETC7_KALBG|nr:Nucleoside diphosphate kinase [Kalmanozyma brasiliensis GHG001]EST05254.1 Nucleoside diphosphate kinase [Kalmanozyma brasiliensis GHG001]
MFARSAIPAFRAASRSFTTQAARNVGPASARGYMGAAALAAGGAVAYSAFAAPTVHLEGPKTIAGELGTSTERSYVMIKPDGTSRQIVGDIISRFERRGYMLVAMKTVVPSQELAKEHYIDLAKKPFYGGLVKYITNGTPVVAMVWQGKDVIRQGRRLVGATNPLEANPGSIRGDFCVSVGRNIIHASDSHESATKEIGLWFHEKELATEYRPIAWDMIMADN